MASSMPRKPIIVMFKDNGVDLSEMSSSLRKKYIEYGECIMIEFDEVTQQATVVVLEHQIHSVTDGSVMPWKPIIVMFKDNGVDLSELSSSLRKKYIEYSECITIEFDEVTQQATVLPN